MDTEAIDQLIIAIVQDADAIPLSNALNDTGFPHTRLPTRGGFLHRASEALVVAHPATRKDELIGLIGRHCKKRSEVQIVSMAGDTMLLAEPVEIEVGGATIFGLELERFLRL
jgi:uncharacterized protein YaaQ